MALRARHHPHRVAREDALQRVEVACSQRRIGAAHHVHIAHRVPSSPDTGRGRGTSCGCPRSRPPRPCHRVPPLTGTCKWTRRASPTCPTSVSGRRARVAHEQRECWPGWAGPAGRDRPGERFTRRRLVRQGAGRRGVRRLRLRRLRPDRGHDPRRDVRPVRVPGRPAQRLDPRAEPVHRLPVRAHLLLHGGVPRLQDDRQRVRRRDPAADHGRGRRLVLRAAAGSRPARPRARRRQPAGGRPLGGQPAQGLADREQPGSGRPCARPTSPRRTSPVPTWWVWTSPVCRGVARRSTPSRPSSSPSPSAPSSAESSGERHGPTRERAPDPAARGAAPGPGPGRWRRRSRPSATRR